MWSICKYCIVRLSTWNEFQDLIQEKNPNFTTFYHVDKILTKMYIFVYILEIIACILFNLRILKIASKF